MNLKEPGSPRLLRFAAGLCLSAALGVAGIPAWAAGTAVWEMNTFQDFIRGRFQGVSLSRDGRVVLAPALETVFASDQPVVWSVAQAPDGKLYAGTGHRGRLFEIDKAGKAQVVWTADQPEVFAVAVDRKGAVYAAGSPDGKIYRIEGGKATEYFAPNARYVWSLAVGPDGALYAGTGDQGRIFRIASAGSGEVYYETGQAHVTSLAVDNQGRLLAGTEPNGILYRVTAKDKAFALYDAGLPEIRAIVPAPDGAIYAAALGGSVARRAQSAQQALQGQTAAGSTPAVTTTITVAAEAAQAAPDLKQPEAAKPAQQAAQPQVTTQFSPLVDLAGVEKSALFKINPDNTVETLFSSKEENIYDLVNLPDGILFSTDSSGRVYRLSPDRKVTLLAQTNESEAVRLLADSGGVLAATGNMGRIYRLGSRRGSTGTYASPVHDAGTVARWGRLSWRGEGGRFGFQTRSGNSARPDKTWSGWEDVAPGDMTVRSPNARFIQWKAEFVPEGGTAPVLDSVAVAYLPQNSPPAVKSVQVSAQPGAAAPPKPSQPTSGAYSITVTDTGDVTTTSSAGTPTQPLSRASEQQINITWQADDPDSDRLIYALYFRGEGEQEWKLIKGSLHETSYLLDGDVLADGKYFFKVIASDKEVNSPSSAREAELISAPILIDNTPPTLTASPVRRSGSSAEIEFQASDAASPLRRCEYSLDAGNWIPVDAADGVVDSLQERFVLRLENLAPGERLVVLRTFDSGNNAGLLKIVLR